MQLPSEKKGLTAAELAHLALINNSNTDQTFFPIENIEITDLPEMAEVFDGSLRVRFGKLDTLMISSFTKNGSDYRAFKRYRTVARLLWYIAEIIPNFIGMKNNRVAVYNSDPVGYVIETLSYPLQKLSYADVLQQEEYETHTVMSMYAQVMHAIEYAYKHAEFSHNMLNPFYILLSTYSKVFSINYNTKSILCFDYIAVITNYQASQISYVDTIRRETAPYPDMDADYVVNLRPSFSSDAYAFTKACYEMAVLTLERTAKISQFYNEVNRRKHIFEALLRYFVKTTKNLPTQIEPYGTPGMFLKHISDTFNEHGLNLIRNVTPWYGNNHLVPEIRARKDTWYALDIRALSANSSFTINNATINMLITYAKRMVTIDGDNYFTSPNVRALVVNLLSGKLKPSPESLETVRYEFPFFLTAGHAYDKMIGTDTAYMRSRIEEILNEVVIRAGEATYTIKDFLEKK